jgi:DNA-binding NtrC family response regulator
MERPTLLVVDHREIDRKLIDRTLSAEGYEITCAALVAYDFPGNVRELENLVERAYALGAGEMISLDDLPGLAPRAGDSPRPDGPPLLHSTLARVERELIVCALETHGQDRESAARALGISTRTLYRRLREHGLA